MSGQPERTSAGQRSRRRRTAGTRVLPVVLLCLTPWSLAQAGAAVQETDRYPRIRPTGPRAVYTLNRARERCPTIRALVAELQAADTIVYVTVHPRPAGPAATIAFVGATAVSRFLRVTLSDDLTTRQMIILLGHELQHAVEVARAPGVLDRATFDAHYKCFGSPTADPKRFDTPGALLVAERVRRELALARSVR